MTRGRCCDRKEPKDLKRILCLYDNLEVIIGACLQCVKEPTNEVGKNAVAVVRTNSHCQEEVAGHV